MTGWAGEVPPVDALPRVAEILATRHHLQSMLIQIRKARRDLAVPPRFEGPDGRLVDSGVETTLVQIRLDARLR